MTYDEIVEAIGHNARRQIHEELMFDQLKTAIRKLLGVGDDFSVHAHVETDGCSVWIEVFTDNMAGTFGKASPLFKDFRLYSHESPVISMSRAVVCLYPHINHSLMWDGNLPAAIRLQFDGVSWIGQRAGDDMRVRESL